MLKEDSSGDYLVDIKIRFQGHFEFEPGVWYLDTLRGG